MTNSTNRRSSFIIHKDSLVILKEMTNEQAGIFIKAIQFYQENNHLPELDFGLKMAISPFINQFIRDEDNYAKTCEARRLAGSEGGKQKVANASNCKQKVANLADNKNKNKNKNESENKSDNKIKIPDFINAELWNGFLEMRTKAKAKPTDLAVKGILEKLEKFEDKKQGSANESLKNSIENNWRGVFEPKSSPNYQSQSPLGWLNK